MKRRILSIVTALALCLSLCPTWAFAVEEVLADEWDLQAAPDEANTPAPIDEPTAGVVARVEKEGEEPAYFTNLADAFAAGNDGATVTLLGDVRSPSMLSISSSSNITLNGGDYTLSIQGFMVGGGQLDITGGMFEMDGGLMVSGGAVHLFRRSGNVVL